MPLVPGTMSQPENKTEEWSNKLVGKTISDNESNETCFCKKDLPEEHRVIGPNTMTTRDFRMNRLNVHVTDEGIVSHVSHG